MTTPESSIEPLALLQRRFCAWLAEPDEEAAAAIAATLGVGPGLTVYQNNYRVALVEALRESFARAALWLGDAAFEAAAARHIDASPPDHWTLDAYGDGFAERLDALFPGNPVAGELARIDHAIGTAFVARDAAPIEPAALAEVDWDNAVIRPVPSLARLSLATNADAIWLALAQQEETPAPARDTATVMVWRQGFEPVMRRIDAEEAMMLDASLSGRTFAEICALLAETRDEAEAVTCAGTVLGRWISEGIVADLA